MATTAPIATKQMVNPSRVIFNYMKEKQRVCVWLVHDAHTRYEGDLVGYDEFMNVVLDHACEINLKKRQRAAGEGPAAAAPQQPLGKILLKGDTVGLIHPIGV
ncbi:small nuclear ribonucleoprotein E [Strigomonas culicis]|uniref:Small nuclear ribonucleoprotein E n=1 Tax=Strigomonas culicis TaxID=28005 RepID=S9W2C1_9TRYP|nr:small nuclear ribonucleoprotein E [Strigomonas culicis]|eukprot:EPY29980.1 small nuclear ribonucleoprotein E [Strigomonas culicis]